VSWTVKLTEVPNANPKLEHNPPSHTSFGCTTLPYPRSIFSAMPFEIVEDRDQSDREFRSAFVYLNNGDIEAELPDEWEYVYEPEESYDAEFFEQKRGSLIGVTPSKFVEFAVMMPDKESNSYKRFDFSERRYLRQIYDTPSIRTLLKCGRQVEKSTLLGNKQLAYACINSALNVLYVSPTNTQTKTFSNDRLREPIETSPYLKSWTTSKLSDSVMLKKFINRSQITLRYAFLNADRCRGIPADVICLDEIQDLLTDNIGVIEECASHSSLNIGGKVHKGGIFMYSGTPKSLDNTLEYKWVNESTQNEWAVPCHRHAIQIDGKMSNVYWNILTEDHIGLKGIVCDRCHKPINVADDLAAWVSLNPNIWRSAKIKSPFEGFRIPQLMVPWIKHDNLIQKQATYSRATFYNEVLGLSYDSGTRPLTRQDVIDNCDSRLLLTPQYQNDLTKILGGAFPVYAGIDWGGGTEHSFTVLSLGAYMGDGKFTIFYMHRFEGPEMEPEVQMEEISRLINKFRVSLIGCDWGGGHHPNSVLIRRFGFQRVPLYQYSNHSTKVAYQPGLNHFLVHRTEVMSDIFNAIKRRNVFRFPNWEQFQSPFAEDMLNIFSEYNEQIRQNVYKKSPNNTDDSFHSILLCFLASMIHNPRPDIIAPNANPGRAPKKEKES
jgi:hypothetical protein